MEKTEDWEKNNESLKKNKKAIREKQKKKDNWSDEKQKNVFF